MRHPSPASRRAPTAKPLRAALVAGFVAIVAACASPPDVETLMPGYPPGRTYTEAQARAALEAVDSLRSRWETRWSAATARCHGRFLASDCVGRVDAERRVVTDELDRVALEATRALREHAAVERNADEARRRAEAADGAAGGPRDGASGRAPEDRALRGIAERPAGD
jgi:hypothetical protein